MRHCAQAFFRNQPSCGTAYSVAFVVDALEGGLQVVYELELTFCQTCVGFAFESVGYLFKDFECVRSIGCVVSIVVHNRRTVRFVKFSGRFQFRENELTEFLQLFVAVSQFICHFNHFFK